MVPSSAFPHPSFPPSFFQSSPFSRAWAWACVSVSGFALTFEKLPRVYPRASVTVPGIAVAFEKLSRDFSETFHNDKRSHLWRDDSRYTTISRHIPSMSPAFPPSFRPRESHLRLCSLQKGKSCWGGRKFPRHVTGCVFRMSAKKSKKCP